MKYTQFGYRSDHQLTVGFEIPDKDGREIKEIGAYCANKNMIKYCS